MNKIAVHFGADLADFHGAYGILNGLDIFVAESVGRVGRQSALHGGSCAKGDKNNDGIPLLPHGQLSGKGRPGADEGRVFKGVHIGKVTFPHHAKHVLFGAVNKTAVPDGLVGFLGVTGNFSCHIVYVKSGMRFLCYTKRQHQKLMGQQNL